MHLCFYFILILSLVGSAGADPVLDYFEDLPNQKYWDGDWEIANEEGTPIKDVQYSDHIRGWIDIIGFRKMCNIDGVDYVNGYPRDFAIVKCDAWHTEVDGVVVSFSSHYVVEDRNGVTTAIQYTNFHWKYKVCSLLGGCHWVHVREHQTITYSTASPVTYTTRIQDVPIKVEVHNRSFQPITCIIIPKTTAPSMVGVVDVQIEYNGSNAARFDQVGFVIDNCRGTEYVEFNRCKDPTWTQDDNQNVVSHFLREAVIYGPAFNMSKLTIQMRTPYETRDVTNYTVSTLDEKPIKLNVPIIRIFALLCGSVLAIFAMWKVITRVLSH